VVDGAADFAVVLRTTGSFFIFGGAGGVAGLDSIALKYLSAKLGSPASVIRLVAMVSRMITIDTRIIAGLLNCRL
jgi:hypothetical protein